MPTRLHHHRRPPAGPRREHDGYLRAYRTDRPFVEPEPPTTPGEDRRCFAAVGCGLGALWLAFLWILWAAGVLR